MSPDAEKERAGGEPQSPGRMPRQKLAGTLVLLLCTAALFAGAVAIFLPFVAPIVVATVLAILGYPLFQRLLRLVGEKHRGVASGLMCGALLLAVVAPVGAFLYYVNESWPAAKAQLRDKAIELNEQVGRQEFLESTWLARYKEPIRSGLSKVLEKVLPLLREPEKGVTPAGATPPAAVEADAAPSFSTLGQAWQWIQRAAGVVGSVFKGVIQFILVLFILFFFLKDGDNILAGIQARIPLEKSQQDDVIQTFKQVTRSVVRGSLVTAAVQGAVATVGYAIIGMPALPLLAAATIIAALVPPLGTGLVMVPLALGTGFIYGNWGQATFLFVLCGIVGALDNILKPLLLRGGGIRVHSIWLLLAILGGIDFFGPMGFLYGPLVLVLLGTFVALFVGGKASEPTAATPAPRQRAQPAEAP